MKLKKLLLLKENLEVLILLQVKQIILYPIKYYFLILNIQGFITPY